MKHLDYWTNNAKSLPINDYFKCQCNRIGNPEMDPQLYDQLIFNKSGNNIQ